MMANREHVGFEELNDFVDGLLDRKASAAVSAHLADCKLCRSEHDELTSLLSAASATRLSVDPGEDLWADVKQVIDGRKEVALRGTGSAPVKLRIQVSPVFLAAAAIILIIVSSGITAVMLRSPSTTIVEAPRAVPEQGGVLPVVVQATEDEYARTIADLRLAVDAQRANLSPETIRTVDRSLAVVDGAIAEARAALIADPNNRTLVDLLASSYQRKLDLLRRTSELSSKI